MSLFFIFLLHPHLYCHLPCLFLCLMLLLLLLSLPHVSNTHVSAETPFAEHSSSTSSVEPLSTLSSNTSILISSMPVPLDSTFTVPNVTFSQSSPSVVQPDPIIPSIPPFRKSTRVSQKPAYLQDISVIRFPKLLTTLLILYLLTCLPTNYLLNTCISVI